MTNQENRVLSRKGARCLSEQELNMVSGSDNTNNCSVHVVNGKLAMDGDAC
jgi:hypothetical protein